MCKLNKVKDPLVIDNKKGNTILLKVNVEALRVKVLMSRVIAVLPKGNIDVSTHAVRNAKGSGESNHEGSREGKDFVSTDAGNDKVLGFESLTSKPLSHSINTG